MVQNLKKYAAAGLAALLLFVVGGLVGRATAPAHVEERVQIKTVEVEKIKTEWKDRIVIQKVFVKDAKKDVVRHEREVIRPDGTVEREKTETESTQSTTKTTEASVQEQTLAQESIRNTEQTVVSVKKQDAAPEWSFAVMVGASPRAGFMPPVLPPPVVVGVHVQKKILGPVTFGAWVLTSPAVGVSLGAQF